MVDPDRTSASARLIAPLLFALVALLALLFWSVGIPLDRARGEILAGQPERAAATLESWAWLRMRPASYEQLLAAAYLLAGDRGAAEPWLARAGTRRADWMPALAKPEAGRLFLSRGLYEEYLAWDEAVRVRRESNQVRLYRAAALLGAGRIEEAEATARTIGAGGIDPERRAALLAALARRREGAYPLVVDREGRTIASWQMANRDLVPLNTDFAPLVDRSGGESTFEARLEAFGTANLIETTLDSRVQRIALEALAPYRGSLVAIDPRTAEILAVASTPGEGEPRNLAFEGSYEPGSIIKVLTALAAIDHGGGAAEVFPLECAGLMEIDGRRFYDWARHGRVADLDEAMAVSCNVAFARIGLRLGLEPLREVMSKSRFGERVRLGAFEVPLGSQIQPVDHAFMLANFAIGLEVQRVNALHVAMLASMLANRGTMVSPRLIRARRSILGEPITPPRSGFANVVVPPAVVDRIRPSLRAVVTDPRGTGRRAALDELPIAMKTGTSGDPLGGYDSVILAWAPADEPRIAFGMIAENAGPAELAGAAITREFLSRYFAADR